jgi:hypothetical protein
LDTASSMNGDAGTIPDAAANGAVSEETPLLPESTHPGPRQRIRRKLLPDISPESVDVVIKLCVLFGLDAFASGFATL